ncbi:MAG: OprO/OprP family phosphate-selective porin [Gammaproteobacteria bacterium]|nr:OprO/OprP family phosphate-selective porin [Gammaproteobacteria bacterium]
MTHRTRHFFLGGFLYQAFAAFCLALVFAGSAFAEVTTRGGLEAGSQGFSFELHGRIMIDAALFDQDITPMEDGIEVRRARLGVEGRLYENWGYLLQVDFAGGDAEAKNLFISYNGLDNATIFIGQFKQFFGLAERTSTKYITFMEVASPMVFAPSYRLGVGYLWTGRNMTFGGSVYGNEIGAGTTNDGPVNLSGRFTFAPIDGAERLLHLGVSVARESVNDTHSVTFAARPESHLAPKLIGTTIEHVDHLLELGLEAAWVTGPFSLQGEYIATRVQRSSGFADATLGGYYLQASYFLTGESRPYQHGNFGRVTPLGNAGAWQLALRFSHLDLNDGPIHGGDLGDITFGVNYYVNPHVRFMMNLIKVRADTGAYVDKPYILQFRAQLDF